MRDSNDVPNCSRHLPEADGTAGRRAPSAAGARGTRRAPLRLRRPTRVVDDARSYLNGRGIGRGDRVAIVLPNGPEMAAAFVSGGLRRHGAPLNPGYRAEEFEFYLTDLRAKALIVEQGSSSPAIAVAGEARACTLLELSAPQMVRACRRIHVVSRHPGPTLRAPAARRAGRTRPPPGPAARRHRAHSAHVRHHLAPQDRAA